MTPWYAEPANLAQLYRWLREQGREPEDPANFMERPWSWDQEWAEFMEREMVA